MHDWVEGRGGEDMCWEVGFCGVNIGKLAFLHIVFI